MLDKTDDKYAGAKEQAQAQFDSIKEMVEALQKPDSANFDGNEDRAREAAERAIHEDALSVEVRSDWIVAGEWQISELWNPAEYRILLCTGGPAVQIVGTLREHSEPETARLEMQDWFLPWTEYRPFDVATNAMTDTKDYFDQNAEATLLAYARCFYFGE